MNPHWSTRSQDIYNERIAHCANDGPVYPWMEALAEKEAEQNHVWEQSAAERERRLEALDTQDMFRKMREAVK